MSILAPTEALARARELVASSPAEETEVAIDAVEERFVRFAPGGPTQSADRERCDVAIRVRVRPANGGAGACEAKASATSLAPRDLAAALARALAIARASSPDPALVPLGDGVVAPESAGVPATATHPFAEKARWVALAQRACAPHGLAPAGLATTSIHVRALANSRGRGVSGASSRAAFALTASADATAGFAEHIAADVRAIAPEAVVARAVEKARAARTPRDIPPGEYTVVLEPSAVSALLTFAALQGFGAQALEEQSSFLCGRVGAQTFASALSIVDDVRHPSLAGLSFDGEGSPRRRTLLVDRGRLVGPVTDRASAARLGVESSGHALPQPCVDGPRPQHLVVLPGADAIDDLVGRVERGLLISQLHYVNLIEPRELVLTGVTRNGTFWIERGRVTHAVTNLRFTESLVRALQRVVGVGCDAVVASSALDGDIVAPALAIEGFRFTSSAGASSR